MACAPVPNLVTPQVWCESLASVMARRRAKVFLIPALIAHRAAMPGKYLSQEIRQQCRDLHRSGVDSNTIAKELRISVSSAKRHGSATGSTANKPKSGRPLVLKVQQCRVARRLAKSGHTTVSIANHLSSRHGVGVSRVTVGRVLKRGRRPLQYLPIIRGRRLSPTNMQKRIAFCQQSSGRQWCDVVFVDSKYLYVYKDQARGWLYKWQDPHNRVVVPQHPNPYVFHFYAAVGTNFKSSLVFVPPTKGEGVDDPTAKTTFKSSHFLAAMQQLQPEMEEGFRGGAGFRVVLDHARQHTSKEAKAGLGMLDMPILEGFPPQSWDMNAIEVCWSWLDQNLRGHSPRSWGGWKKAILRAWSEVQQSSINKLVKRVPKQVEKIIEADGKWCKYFP